MHIPTTAAILAIGSSLLSVVAAQAADVCPPADFFLDTTGKNAITYKTNKAWEMGRRVYFWDFGPYSTATGPATEPSASVAIIPVWVFFYPNGTKAGQGLIDKIPCEPGYSDLWAATNITLKDASLPLNYYKDASVLRADIAANKVIVTDLGMSVNCPVVPFKSTVMDDSPNPAPQPVKGDQGWYKGREVFYFDFGPV
ncbi:hypothetical protein HDU67_000250, partial [Dinochytrium kinnereticum]